MFANPEMLLPLAFSVSGLLIAVALVLVGVSTRQIQQLGSRASARKRIRTQKVESPAQWKRVRTQHMFSGATVAALDELTRVNPARQRQARIYG